MKLTGETKLILGRKLYQRSDGWWQDDTGTVFDVSGSGKLYEQRRPGVWFWIRPDAQTRHLERSTAVPRDVGDALLASLDAPF